LVNKVDHNLDGDSKARTVKAKYRIYLESEYCETGILRHG